MSIEMGLIRRGDCAKKPFAGIFCQGQIPVIFIFSRCVNK